MSDEVLLHYYRLDDVIIPLLCDMTVVKFNWLIIIWYQIIDMLSNSNYGHYNLSSFYVTSIERITLLFIGYLI